VGIPSGFLERYGTRVLLERYGTRVLVVWISIMAGSAKHTLCVEVVGMKVEGVMYSV